MRRAVYVLCLGLTLGGAAFAVNTKIGPLPAAAKDAESPAGLVSKDGCLECHGPYDKLAGASAAFAEPKGEKVNPHVYVPHASREAKAVPECANCHEPHAIPPGAEKDKARSKANVEWCYNACHHNNDFEPCKNCHK